MEPENANLKKYLLLHGLHWWTWKPAASCGHPAESFCLWSEHLMRGRKITFQVFFATGNKSISLF